VPGLPRETAAVREDAVKLLTGVLHNGEPYLEPGVTFRRTDVAGMMFDFLPCGTLFGEDGTVWEVDRCGQRPMLVADDGRVLWAQENGYARLVDTDTMAGGLGL